VVAVRAADREVEPAAEQGPEQEVEQAAQWVAAEWVAAETPRPRTRDTNSPAAKALGRAPAISTLFAQPWTRRAGGCAHSWSFSGASSVARRVGRSVAFAAN
jgi:hypothetical protein